MNRVTTISEKQALFRLAQCEAKIAKLESKLEQQKALKTTIEDELNAIRSSNAPIRLLPKELIVYIFAQLVRDDPANMRPVLSVCRHWNHIATNTPTLWSHISTTLKTDADGIAKQSRYLEAALRYSGTSPLSIALHIPDMTNFWWDVALKLFSPPPGCVPRILDGSDISTNLYSIALWFLTRDQGEALLLQRMANDAISDHVHMIPGVNGQNIPRLKSFTICFNSAEFKGWIQEEKFLFFRHPTPLLEELTFVDYNAPSTWEAECLFNHPAPSLTKVSWKTCLSLEQILTKPCRLTYLRFSLSAHNFSCFPDISFTQNIRYLFLEIPHQLPEPVDNRNFSFSKLNDLEIMGSYPIGLVTAPSLRSLRLVTTTSCDTFVESPPCFPSITKLHVWATPNRVEAVEEYVGQLPLLEELGFLNRSEARIKDCMYKANEGGIGRVSVKGYLYHPEDFRWSFDSYEHYKEIKLDL